MSRLAVLLNYLRWGVLRLVTPLGPRYVRPRFLERVYLIWVFRNFRAAQQVLSRTRVGSSFRLWSVLGCRKLGQMLGVNVKRISRQSLLQCQSLGGKIERNLEMAQEIQT